jgi:uncharacterized protein (TIRG00374 family)
MKTLNAVLFVLGLVLLGWLVRQMDAARVCHELRSLRWGFLPFVLGEGVAEMFHTVGWRHCTSGAARSLSWPLLFRVRMAGYAINYVTPACLGGEVSKAALLASHQRGPDAVSGLLIEKVSFGLAQLAFAAIGCLLFAERVRISPALLIPMLIGTALIAGGLIAFLLLQRHGRLGGLLRWITKRTRRKKTLKALASHVSRMDQMLGHFYREQPRDFFFAIAWHVVGFSVGILQAWLLLRLLGEDASLSSATLLCCLGMWFDLLTFAIPLNAGVLEGGRTLAAKIIGYSTIVGFTYGLAVRVSQLFWTAFGLASYAALMPRKRNLATFGNLSTCSSKPVPLVYDLDQERSPNDLTPSINQSVP